MIVLSFKPRPSAELSQDRITDQLTYQHNQKHWQAKSQCDDRELETSGISDGILIIAAGAAVFSNASTELLVFRHCM